MLADVGSELSGYLAGLDADPARLQEVLARQAALRALTRRYGEDVDAVLAWARSAAQELLELDSSEHRLAELQTELDDLRRGAGSVGRAGCRASDRRPRTGWGAWSPRSSRHWPWPGRPSGSG